MANDENLCDILLQQFAYLFRKAQQSSLAINYS